LVFRPLSAALKLLLTYFCRIQNDLKPKSMQYHEIGKTGMKVSSLSFGASSLGGVFHDLKEKEGIQAMNPLLFRRKIAYRQKQFALLLR
jgi:hypothetical protein